MTDSRLTKRGSGQSRAGWELGAAALMLAVGIAALAYFFLPASPELPSRSFESPRVLAPSFADPSCAATNIKKLSNEEALQKQYECQKSREEYRVTTNDLIQQARAADAASAQTYMAWQANRLAFFQSIGALFTLIAAGLAVIHAARSSEIAQDALADQRAAALETERPWLSIEVCADADITLTNGSGKILLELCLYNSGNRVAKNVSAWTTLYQGSGLDDFEKARSVLEAEMAKTKKYQVNEIRSVIPGRELRIRQAPTIDIVGKAFVRALAAVRYTISEGKTGYSWEVYKIETTKVGGGTRSIAATDTFIVKNEVLVKSAGLTDAV